MTIRPTDASRRAPLSHRALLGALMLLASAIATSTVGCGSDERASVTASDDAGPTTEAGTKDTGVAIDGGSDFDSGDAGARTDGSADGAADASLDGSDATDGDGALSADASLPTFAIDSVAVDEGNAGTVAMTFTVTLSAASAATVTVDFATADGTASTANTSVGGADYSATSGTLTFAPGDVTKTITVNVNGDVINEANETLTVNLSNPSNATLAQGTGTGTINNDDVVPTVSIGDVLVTEGNAGTTPATFKVTLSGPSGQVVTVHAATADGTATVANSDYTAIADQTVTFNPGETSKDVVVDVVGDVTAEPNETFAVNLSAATNATLGTASGTGTIQNDDGPAVPALNISDVSVAEGNAGTKTMSFAVTLGATSTQTVTVDFKTTDATAIAGGTAAAGGLDYVATNGTLSFAPGETTKNVVITLNSDTVNENDETFTVDLSNATNALVGKSQGIGTIVNDDAAPTVTIGNATIAEGQAGVKALTFTLTLSASSGIPVAVAYATTDSTAVSGGTLSTGGQDYVASTGTVNFAPGTTTQTVSVSINGDTLNEASETFNVTLSAPVNATLGGQSQGVGTIVNDDPMPSVIINDVAVSEGNSGTTAMVFTVSMVDANQVAIGSGRTVTVDFATANGTATAGSDFVATSGTVTFQPGQTQQTISVQVIGDTTTEPNETFSVTLSNPSNAVITQKSGTGTIINDDGILPFLNVSNASVTEGNSGTATLSFTVTLSAAAQQNVTVDFASANGTAVSTGSGATGGSDYVPTSGTLTFTPGQTSKVVTVTVNGDVANEGDDTVQLVLFNVSSNAVIQDGLGVGTIVNDDSLPVLSIGNATVVEGNAGTTVETFTVTLSAVSGRTVQVNFATADGSAKSGGLPAAGGADYVGTSGTLTFNPGQTTQTISVTVNGDSTREANDSYTVSLSSAVNASLGASTGNGTITNDDAIPSITIADVSLAEGTPAPNTRNSTPFSFTVTLSNPSAQAVSVLYVTSDGTATTAGNDYLSTAGVLNIAAGATTGTITVLVRKDAVIEPNETFMVTLSSPTNATISDGLAIGTILNDD